MPRPGVVSGPNLRNHHTAHCEGPMAGIVKAPLVTYTVPATGIRDSGRLAGLRTTPGRLRAGVALVVLLVCALGLLTGIVFAALDSGFTAIGGHDAPLVEQSNAL